MSTNSNIHFQMWQENNFRGDLHVSRMAPGDRSALRSMLIQGFVYETAPLIPSDDETLMALAEIDDPTEWDQRRSRILKRFYEVKKDGIAYLRHPILDRSFEDMTERARVRSEAAKAGKAKYKKVDKDPEALLEVQRDSSSDERPAGVDNPAYEEGRELVGNIVDHRFGGAISPSLSEQRKYGQWFQSLIDSKSHDTSHWFDVVEWIWTTDNFYRSEQFANCKTPSTLLKSFTNYADKIEQSYLESH